MSVETAAPQRAPAQPKREPAPAEIINRVVREIRLVKRNNDLGEVFEIANVLLEAFFDGDIEVYRERGEDDPSVRKVAEHADLPLSGITLYRYLRIADLAARLGGVARFANLELSHFREVLGLPFEQQKSLLETANAEGWKVDQLAQAASHTRVKTDVDASRHLRGELDRTLRDLARASEESHGLLADMQRAGVPANEKIGRLLADLRTEVQRVVTQLAAAEREKKQAKAKQT